MFPRASRFGFFLFVMSIGMMACKIPVISTFLATPTATITPTATSTPTPTPTLTPTPSPTPLPVTRIEAGDKVRLYGDWDTALAEYQGALLIAQDPAERAAAELGIGFTYLQAGRYYESFQSLTVFLDQYPDSAARADGFFLRAQASLALGEDQQAIEDFDRYLSYRPGILDAYVHERVGDALRNLGNPIDAIGRYQMAINSLQIGGTIGLQIKLGHTFFEAGEYIDAYQKFNEVYQLSADPDTKAAMNLMAGRSLEAIGDYEAAYERYLDSFYAFPQVYETYLGLITLVNVGVVVDEFQRGLVDYHAKAYEPALAAFNRFIASTPTGTAFFYRGMTRSGAGDPWGALQDFQIVIDTYMEDAVWTNTWFEKAHTEWIHLSDPNAAIQTYLSFVENAPSSASAPEALFQAARIAERQGALRDAETIWMRVPQEYPEASQAYEGAYLAGITRFRIGLYSEARDAFLLADAITSDEGEKAAARLWVGKTHSAQGDLDAAVEAWVTAAVMDPTGYYSERASDLIDGREPFETRGDFSFPSDLTHEREEAEIWMRETFIIQGPVPLSELDPILASDPRLQRGVEFWRLGLFEESRAEFEALRESYAANAEATYRLMHELLDLGLYRSAIFAARNILSLAGMGDAETMEAPGYFNYIRFGAYYGDLILPEAERQELDALFVFSVVRQESLFEGFAISYADARGLMQVIPSTGQDIANKLSWPPEYTAEDLYRPIVSVRFGTDYLAEQRDYFDGDLVAALSAYNAGPGNTSIWIKLAPEDPDLYLEIIRLDQPQRYIRTIFEVFDIYSDLYVTR